MPQSPNPLNVHVLVDLEWNAASGGQVMCWQYLSAAAAHVPGLSLTVHAQGPEENVVTLNPQATLRLHKPVFSTRNIPFLHAPAHTDMADYHPALAKALEGADVIHTTDGFFAYAQTAEKVARRLKIPLVHSVHTDTVSYAALFARSFFKKNLGPLAFLDDALAVSKTIGRKMQKRLDTHESRCRFVLTAREEDRILATRILGHARVKPYRLGLDRAMFNPAKRDRAALEAQYAIPPNAIVILFVGRLDEGKNISRLIGGMERAIKNGAPLFLITVGLGPAQKEIQSRLGHRAATPGFLNPEQLSPIYASADWLALPSTVETWSLVAEESLASGLPVMASSASGVGRFLGAEGAGLLVRDDSDAAWEAALMEACGLQDMDHLRTLARAAAVSQFPGWDEALAQDFLPVWQEAAREG
jgi:glycosyltransferase involved in cell wall biosynthesis